MSSGIVRAPPRRDTLAITEPFPEELISFLSSLPPKSDHEEGRARKRARTDQSERSPWIVIARETLLMSRPCRPEDGQSDVTFERCDVGRDLAVSVGDFDKYNEGCSLSERRAAAGSIGSLTLSSKSRSKFGSVQSHLSPGAMTASKSMRIFTMLDDPYFFKRYAVGYGALRTEIGVRFDRKEGWHGLKSARGDHLELRLELKWKQPVLDEMRIRPSERKASLKVLKTFLAAGSLRNSTGANLSTRTFYEAAPMPSSTEEMATLEPDLSHLTLDLYPFQRRALDWLLKREGVCWVRNSQTGVTALEAYTPPSDELPFSFRVAKDADGQDFSWSPLYHVVSRDPRPYRRFGDSGRGGILAEEMGLGKTVEMMSLIVTHRCPNKDGSVFDAHTEEMVRSVGTTLVITPATLKMQWFAEFKRHCPQLVVMLYDGLKASKKRGEAELMEEMAGADVVITTYTVLQSEIHFTGAPPGWAMRHERQDAPRKSPLMQLLWWRVCLDEAQQVNSGLSAAARLARSIPRCHAWAVTGTPVKDSIADLCGSLVFLRYTPWDECPELWTELLQHKDLLQDLIRRIAIRHTKRAVRGELRLPSQKRYVISVPFSPVEEQNYRAQFQRVVRQCGLDSDGAPLRDGWDPRDPATRDMMKLALAQLRQTVLHPNLGMVMKRGAPNEMPLGTMDEVLDGMMDISEAAIKQNQKQLVEAQLRQAQHVEDVSEHWAEEIQVKYEDALGLARSMVQDCRDKIGTLAEGARQAGLEGLECLDSEEDDRLDLVNDPGSKRLMKQLVEARRSLRRDLMLEHRAVFLMARANQQAKLQFEPESRMFGVLEDRENEGYVEAKQVRAEIMRASYTKATSLMLPDASSLCQIPVFSCVTVPRTAEAVASLCAFMDRQSAMIGEWRVDLVAALGRPVVDEDETVDFVEEMGTQDSIMAYMLTLRAAVADRSFALTGLANELVRVETKTAMRMARANDGPCPELMLSLLQRREQDRPRLSLRAIVAHMRELLPRLRQEASSGARAKQLELKTAEDQLRSTQASMAEHGKVVGALEKELAGFTATMNARLEYYKQLQIVSDGVAMLEQGDDKNMVAESLPPNQVVEREREISLEIGLEKDRLEDEITTGQARHRYLRHLKESGSSPDNSICVVCQSEMTLGVLTICGHKFCKACIVSWWKTKQDCPVCKTALTARQIHDITFKKQEPKIYPADPASNQAGHNDAGRLVKEGIYTAFGKEKLEAIQNMKLDGPAISTKMDMMLKHILWLREAEPGAKSVIFSQFKGFLKLLGHVLAQYRIGYSTFTEKDGVARFKEEAGCECFLMDARAHASGLNLINANHVFLCEPLLNTALELQAIARVDRIGQQHETTVWLYLVEGTIEESIYNLSVQRRVEHMGRHSTGRGLAESPPEMSDLNIEAANSMELEQATSRLVSTTTHLPGEVVPDDDLWQCLFGHMATATAQHDGHQAEEEGQQDADEQADSHVMDSRQPCTGSGK